MSIKETIEAVMELNPERHEFFLKSQANAWRVVAGVAEKNGINPQLLDICTALGDRSILESQAHAWGMVFNVINEIDPYYFMNAKGSGQDNACNFIRTQAQLIKLLQLQIELLKQSL